MSALVKLRRLSSRLTPRRTTSCPAPAPGPTFFQQPLCESPTPSVHNGSTTSLSEGSSTSYPSTPPLTSPPLPPDSSPATSPRSSRHGDRPTTLKTELVSGAKQLFFKRRVGALACLALSLTIDRAIIPENMAHLSTVEGPSDLLSQSIAISKMLVNAGEAAPVPYVKSTAGLILGILEPIKLYQKNQDDHNELIDKIGTIVTMMKDLALDPDSPPQSPKIKENLDQFRNSMSSVIQDLHTTMQGYSIPQQLWKTYSIGEWLRKSEQVIDELRLNRLVESSLTTHIYAREIHKLIVPKHTGSPQLTSSLTENELSDYTRLVPGEILLISTCHTPFGAEVEFQDVDVDNSIVKIGDVYKTGRFYKGDKAAKKWDDDLKLLSKMRDPNIIQLYGICSSELRPALVFHEELHSISIFEKQAMLSSLEFVQWTYFMLLDYESAYCYLRTYAHSQCLDRPRPPNQMYYTGCPCPPGLPHAYRIEAFVNSQGTLNLSIHTDMDFEPPNVYRLGYRSCDEIPSVTKGVLGKIFSPASLEFPKSDFRVDVKKAILNEFHLILLSLGYASETLRVSSPPSNGGVIILGDIFETEPCSMLDEVQETQHKASLGPASHLGRIVFARNIRPSPRYVPPGVRWSHPGARFKDIGEMRRFTISRFKGTNKPDIICSCSIQIMDIYARGSSLLAQIHSMHSKILPYMSNPKATISMTTDATFSFSYQSSFDEQNQQPETKRVYLFVQNLARTANGSISPPEMYWSLDETGVERLGEDTISILGLTLPKIEMVGEGICWSPKQLAALRDLHMDIGFDPDTDEVARFLDPYRMVAKFEPVPDRVPSVAHSWT